MSAEKRMIATHNAISIKLILSPYSIRATTPATKQMQNIITATKQIQYLINNTIFNHLFISKAKT